MRLLNKVMRFIGDLNWLFFLLVFILLFSFEGKMQSIMNIYVPNADSKNNERGEMDLLYAFPHTSERNNSGETAELDLAFFPFDVFKQLVLLKAEKDTNCYNCYNPLAVDMRAFRYFNDHSEELADTLIGKELLIHLDYTTYRKQDVTAAAALLDTLHRKYPESEVGVILGVPGSWLKTTSSNTLDSINTTASRFVRNTLAGKNLRVYLSTDNTVFYDDLLRTYSGDSVKLNQVSGLIYWSKDVAGEEIKTIVAENARVQLAEQVSDKRNNSKSTNYNIDSHERIMNSFPWGKDTVYRLENAYEIEKQLVIDIIDSLISPGNHSHVNIDPLLAVAETSFQLELRNDYDTIKKDSSWLPSLEGRYLIEKYRDTIRNDSLVLLDSFIIKRRIAYERDRPLLTVDSINDFFEGAIFKGKLEGIYYDDKQIATTTKAPKVPQIISFPYWEKEENQADRIEFKDSFLVERLTYYSKNKVGIGFSSSVIPAISPPNAEGQLQKQAQIAKRIKLAAKPKKLIKEVIRSKGEVLITKVDFSSPTVDSDKGAKGTWYWDLIRAEQNKRVENPIDYLAYLLIPFLAFQIMLRLFFFFIRLFKADLIRNLIPGKLVFWEFFWLVCWCLLTWAFCYHLYDDTKTLTSYRFIAFLIILMIGVGGTAIKVLIGVIRLLGKNMSATTGKKFEKLIPVLGQLFVTSLQQDERELIVRYVGTKSYKNEINRIYTVEELNYIKEKIKLLPSEGSELVIDKDDKAYYVWSQVARFFTFQETNIKGYLEIPDSDEEKKKGNGGNDGIELTENDERLRLNEGRARNWLLFSLFYLFLCFVLIYLTVRWHETSSNSWYVAGTLCIILVTIWNFPYFFLKYITRIIGRYAG